MGRAPTFSVDYRKETINVRAGMAWMAGEAGFDEERDLLYVVPDDRLLSRAGGWPVMTKEAQRAGINLGGNRLSRTGGIMSIAASATSLPFVEDEDQRVVGFSVAMAPTESRPGSDAFTAVIYAPAPMNEERFDEIQGFYNQAAGTFVMKPGWEAFVNDKWVRSFRVSETMRNIRIRQTSTARFNARAANFLTGNVGSEEATVTLTWGQAMGERPNGNEARIGRFGIIRAVFNTRGDLGPITINDND